MKDPVPVEHVRASAGLDIGCTLIGMHLKEVAVPLRLAVKHIGEAPGKRSAHAPGSSPRPPSGSGLASSSSLSALHFV